MKALREAPSRTGRPRRASVSSRRDQLQVVPERLAEADPRVDHHPLGGDPARPRARRSAASSSSPTSAATSS